MIPTFDIGVTGILAAIATWAGVVWSYWVRFKNYVVSTFQLWYYGSKLGRVVFEVAIFGVVYAAFLTFMNRVVSWLSGWALGQMPSFDMFNAFSFLNTYFPFQEIIDLIGLSLTLYLGYMGIETAYGVYFRFVHWLSRLKSTGRL